MALRLEDIRVGSLAYFDNALLLAEPEIDSGGDLSAASYRPLTLAKVYGTV